MNSDQLIDLLLSDIKQVFFPSEWLNYDLKFSKSEILTILFLEKKGAMTMTECAEFLNSPMSTTTGIIDRLVKSGYVSRDRSEQDRRIVVLHLKEKGKDFVYDLKELINRYLSKAMNGLSEEEVHFFIRMILKIFHNLKQEDQNQNEESLKQMKNIPIE